jgi:hypothetical protein
MTFGAAGQLPGPGGPGPADPLLPLADLLGQLQQLLSLDLSPNYTPPLLVSGRF